MHATRASQALALALSLCLLPAAAAAEEGGASPEEVFQTMKTAADAGDWPTYFRSGSPDSRPSLLGGILIACTFATMGEGFKPDPEKQKALEALFAEHGVDTEALGGAVSTEPADAKAATAKAFAKVEDPPAFFAAMMQFLERQGQGAVIKHDTGALEGLTIEGGTAKATFQRGGEAKPVHFVLVGERWYADFDKLK